MLRIFNQMFQEPTRDGARLIILDESVLLRRLAKLMVSIKLCLGLGFKVDVTMGHMVAASVK